MTEARGKPELIRTELPECPICYVQFDMESWVTRKRWKECLHFVCKCCFDRDEDACVRCPVCRRGAKHPSRRLDVMYPLISVYGRSAPKDKENRTYADVCMKDSDVKMSWFAETKQYANGEDTRRALADPDWLSNRCLHTLRNCKRHGPFVSRQDKQTGCLRCAQGERRYISVEKESMDFVSKSSKHKQSDHTVIDAWLHDWSDYASDFDDKSDDYDDLNDFIVNDGNVEPYDTLLEKWDDVPKDTESIKTKRAEVSGRLIKRRKIE